MGYHQALYYLFTPSCCVLISRGLCDGLITRPEESYRLWCVVVCDLQTSSRIRRSWPALSCSATGGKKKTLLHVAGARGGAVGLGIALQAGRSRVRFPMVSLEFLCVCVRARVRACGGGKRESSGKGLARHSN